MGKLNARKRTARLRQRNSDGLYTERAVETADSLDDGADNNLASESDERISKSADDQSYEDREDWEILQKMLEINWRVSQGTGWHGSWTLPANHCIIIYQ